MTEQELLDATKAAEQSLLGSLIIDRDAMPLIAGMLGADAFRWESHRVLFQAMQSLWDKRTPADPSTLMSEIRLMGFGEDRFPLSYISGLIASSPTSVHVVYYAKDVIAFAKRRALIEQGTRIVQAAYGSEPDTGELVAALRTAVEPYEGDSVRGTVDMADFAIENADHVVSVWEGLPDPVIRSGIAQLDRMLNGGFRPGQLVMIGARPGMGKTALMTKIAQHSRAHLVSLEMSKGEITNRLTSICGDVPYAIAHDLVAPMHLRQRWTEGAVKASRLPITINDLRQTTAQIEGEVARMIVERGTEIVVIDHLDWLADKFRDSTGQEQRTAELVHRCKAGAKATGIPWVVLAQLNRNVESRPGFVPYLSDFRNSGAIEQDADIAILLRRRRYYSERSMCPAEEEDYIHPSKGDPSLHAVDVIVAKNRNGTTGTARVGWKAETMDFREVAA